MKKKQFIQSALIFGAIIVVFIFFVSRISKKGKAKAQKVSAPVEISTDAIGIGSLEDRVRALEAAVMELAQLSEENADYIYNSLVAEGELRKSSYDNMMATTFAMIDGLEQIRQTLKEPVTGSNIKSQNGVVPEEERIK